MTHCPHYFMGHKEGQRKERSCLSSGQKQAFRNFWNNGDPHHLQILILRKDWGMTT